VAPPPPPSAAATAGNPTAAPAAAGSAPPWGQQVSSAGEAALEEFVRGWRQHFLDIMQPKFLPAFWSVDSRVRNSSAPGCGGQHRQQSKCPKTGSSSGSGSAP
jgi:hypothetical protein